MDKKNHYFSFAEQEILTATKKVAPSVANDLKSAASEDVRMDSVNYINGDSSMQQGQVRSIGARQNPFAPSGTSAAPAASSTNPLMPTIYNNEPISQDNNVWKSGKTDTLILFAVAILVLLVFIVSYSVFNFMN